MPENAHEIHARARDALRDPPVEEWATWPFEGPVHALALEPSGLPIVLILEPRAHFDSPADLPDDLARAQGIMLGRVERAVLSVGEIGRVHIGRWGEGLAHLHWWFIARPAGLPQLASSMAEIWD